MVSRIFALLVLSAASVGAQDSELGRSADDAVATALQRANVEQRLAAEVAAVRAEIEGRTQWSVPELRLSRDQVFGDINVGSLEHSAEVEQTLDLSPWRRELRRSLRSREAALEADADAWRLDAAHAVRLAYFAVQYTERKAAVLRRWSDRLEQAHGALEARREQGDVSAFAVQRTAAALEVARQRLAAAEAEAAEARAELSGWTGWAAEALSETLVPSPVGAHAGGDAERPELQALAHRAAALSRSEAASSSAFWRNWRVAAGYRYTGVGDSSGHGVTISVALPLAFWNPNAAERDRLAAQRAALEGQLRLRRDEVTRQIAAAQARWQVAFEALQNRSADVDAADRLSSFARAAFEAGEASITELLDAYEGERELRLGRLEGEWEARRAALNLSWRLGLSVSRQNASRQGVSNMGVSR